MESFRNNNKTNNNTENSLGNSLKSLNPFSQSQKSTSETAIDDLKSSMDKSFIKKESQKPVSSIMEKMSSVKPLESVKKSLGNASEISKKSLTSVAETVSGESGTSFLKIILYIIVGVLLLAFIGFNVFSYLAEGTDFLTNITAPIVNFFTMITGNTAKTAVSNTSTGSQSIVDNLEKGTVGTIDYIQKNVKNVSDKKQNQNLDKNKNITIVSTENDDSLTDTKKNTNEPEPTRTNSLNQGYCYIGKINDTRYCAKVSGRDQCMSGDIYPSMDICVNPNLRT
tara:strand:+ start:1651 stop:2496 length:846 start_codon:yes stop_codon:yes gene_type:complete